MLLMVWEYTRFIIELIVLAIILYEIRELRKHKIELENHGVKLERSMPLFSTLLSEPDEIRSLALTMVSEAKEMWSMGILDILSRTELHQNGELCCINAPPSDFDKKYATAITDYINSGKPYWRIINFSLNEHTTEAIWRARSNIRFFKRLLEGGGARDLNLHLYHNPDLLSAADEFHFRTTDKRVAIRIGSPNGGKGSAAISITDTRVIEKFVDYFISLSQTANSQLLDLAMLDRLEALLAASDYKGYEHALEKTTENE